MLNEKEQPLFFQSLLFLPEYWRSSKFMHNTQYWATMSAVSPLVLITVSLLHLLANANEIQTNVSTSNCKVSTGISCKARFKVFNYQDQ